MPVLDDRVPVAVALSGGVDSSVTAALLLERGYAVTGLTMRLWRAGSPAGPEEGLSAARAVCQRLGIAHQVVDLREAFSRQVVDHLVAEYAQGRTPNPCLRCNRILKFGALLDHARALGCQYLATGHYARVERAEGEHHLLCGLDAHRDQSYFLYALGQEELAAVLMPLGALPKARVRELARAWALPSADRPESQDLCFLAGQDYRTFIQEQAPEAARPGPIYDRAGRQLGTHKGLPFYTVGQREGLGIAAPRPLYVLRLDVPRNALIVGHAEELGHDALLAQEVTYVSGRALPPGAPIEAKIRYRAPRAPARVWPLPDARARVVFGSTMRDITPGQAVVFYEGERVLGGGIIVGPDASGDGDAER